MSKISPTALHPVAATGWTGWVHFAGDILIINGFFSGCLGLVALTGPDAYYLSHLSAPGALFLFDAQGWAWWNVALGVFLILTSLALISGATWARIVAVLVAGLSVVVQLMLITVQAWWSVIVIAIDMLIIYAVIARGQELRAGETPPNVNS